MRREEEILPQRLHRVCVLLWRLPKDEVPFAVRIDQFAVPCVHIRLALIDILILNQVDYCAGQSDIS